MAFKPLQQPRCNLSTLTKPNWRRGDRAGSGGFQEWDHHPQGLYRHRSFFFLMASEGRVVRFCVFACEVFAFRLNFDGLVSEWKGMVK